MAEVEYFVDENILEVGVELLLEFVEKHFEARVVVFLRSQIFQLLVEEGACVAKDGDVCISRLTQTRALEMLEQLFLVFDKF